MSLIGPISWNPTEAPYRVSWITRDNTPGLHGWSSKSEVFGTWLFARAAANRRTKNLKYVTIERAVNPETWSENGEWKELARRYPKQWITR